MASERYSELDAPGIGRRLMVRLEAVDLPWGKWTG